MQTADGGRLASRVAGNDAGAPVVLLHGMANRSDIWDGIVAALAGRRTADGGRRGSATDLRGHGRTSRAAVYPLDLFRADVCLLHDHLDIDRTDLVGHSLGAHGVAATRPGGFAGWWSRKHQSHTA